MIRRRVFDSLSIPNFRVGEDHLLSIMALKQGVQLAYHFTSSVVYHVEQNSISAAGKSGEAAIKANIRLTNALAALPQLCAMNISVNICTWNRASELRKTLQSMTFLEIPKDTNWELLITNNNCTDETDDVVRESLQKLPIVYLHEHTPSKSHALNLALKHATGELILFTDDDVLVSQAWLKHYANAAADFPNYSVFGGCVIPLYEKNPQHGLKKISKTCGTCSPFVEWTNQHTSAMTKFHLSVRIWQSGRKSLRS